MVKLVDYKFDGALSICMKQNEHKIYLTVTHMNTKKHQE